MVVNLVEVTSKRDSPYQSIDISVAVFPRGQQMTKSWPKFAGNEALEFVKGKLKRSVVVSQEMFSTLESCCVEFWSLVTTSSP